VVVRKCKKLEIYKYSLIEVITKDLNNFQLHNDLLIAEN